MNKLSIVRSLIAIGFLIPLMGALIGCNSGSPGQIELSSAEYDFGTIPNTKPVTQTFEVRNVGRGELEILGVSTSCGCTTAEVSERRLRPGESTELAVSYDPQAHDGATGEFMRIVYVRSDDPETPEANLTVRVTVVEP